MKVEATEIPDVLIVTPARHGDARGFFSETWNRHALAERGIDLDFVQDNHSRSAAAGTVRGLHCQAPPSAQTKLVRVLRGRVFDVAVDVRAGSPHYGRWVGVELSDENGRQLLVPAGFLHGFATLEPDTDVFYKCTDYYDPAAELTVRFDDPVLGIDWGVAAETAILSTKDTEASGFEAFVTPFRYGGAK